jgi:hypothetical protein
MQSLKHWLVTHLVLTNSAAYKSISGFPFLIGGKSSNTFTPGGGNSVHPPMVIVVLILHISDWLVTKTDLKPLKHRV